MMAFVKQISMDAAVAAVLPQVDFAQKVQKTTARAHPVEKMFFTFLQNDFGS